MLGNGIKIQSLFEALIDYAANKVFLWADSQRVIFNTLQADLPKIAVLPILASRAVGGDEDKAHPLTIAWVALRYSAILFDAIQDNHSVPHPLPDIPLANALGIANGLVFEAMNIVSTSYPPELSHQVITLFAQTGINAVQGQVKSLGRIDELEMYWQATILKSGSIFKAGLAGGTLVGNGTPNQILALGNFGLTLGVIRQIYDDCHDKEIGSLIPLLIKSGNQHPAQTITALLLNWRNRAVQYLNLLEKENTVELHQVLDEFVVKTRLRDKND